jgi:hypothetical protein
LGYVGIPLKIPPQQLKIGEILKTALILIKTWEILGLFGFQAYTEGNQIDHPKKN